MSPLADAKATLPDGRSLAYCDWGDPHGTPLFLFHGTPHSRLWCPDEGATAAAGVRLITVDRPGIGGSDVKEARRFSDWPRDVMDLANSLGIDRFAVVGLSGGGIYAAACAALIPSNLIGAGVVSSRHLARYNFVERPAALEQLDPDDRAEYELAEHDPLAAAELAASHYKEWAEDVQAHPEVMFESLKSAEGDRWFFDDEERVAAFRAALHEFFRQGPDGFTWELIDGWFPWGFRLSDIPIRVHLWHGGQDSRVTPADIEFAQSTIPDCEVHIWSDSGHLGVAKHWSEILKTVTEEGRQGTEQG
jgi:pimeloyl-ACP methyl ester carboxylesterase